MIVELFQAIPPIALSDLVTGGAFLTIIVTQAVQMEKTIRIEKTLVNGGNGIVQKVQNLEKDVAVLKATNDTRSQA